MIRRLLLLGLLAVGPCEAAANLRVQGDFGDAPKYVAEVSFRRAAK